VVWKWSFFQLSKYNSKLHQITVIEALNFETPTEQQKTPLPLGNVVVHVGNNPRALIGGSMV